MSDLRELAAAYALDAVDPAERAQLDALMESDPAFRKEVEAFREVSGLMAHAAPVVPPPAALRGRILEGARAVRPIATAPALAGPAPAAAPATARRFSSPLARVLPWMAAAAGLAAAVFNQARLRDTLAGSEALAGELAQVRAQLEEKDRALASFMGTEVHVVSLKAPDREPTARVYWNHSRNVFIVTAFNLPRAPEGKVYQLWAISKERAAPMSMGTFNTDAGGRATVIVPVGSEVNAVNVVELCAVTLEPAGGSAQPTETPRLVGNWVDTD